MDQDEMQKRVEKLLGRSVMFERIDITLNELCDEIERLQAIVEGMNSKVDIDYSLGFKQKD